jgi:acetyl esterase/lipase
MYFLKRVILLPALLVAVAVAPAQQPPQQPAQESVVPRFLRPPPIPEECKVLKDLAYGEHERNKLDLYIPKSDAALPLIIWVHGGGWENGSKFGGGPSLDLLRKGYAVASINYRLSGHAVFPAQIEDCQAAVRWLRSHAKEYNLDPDHFGAWGASAGGHLVALLGTCDDSTFPVEKSEKNCSCGVQAVCDWFGPADFLHWGTITVDSPLANRPSQISRLFGGTVPQKLDLAKQASPVAHVSKNSAPFLIYHGDKDPVVPLQQGEALHEALKKAGVDSTLHVVKGGGHGRPGFDAPEVLQEEEAFFGKYLKAKK